MRSVRPRVMPVSPQSSHTPLPRLHDRLTRSTVTQPHQSHQPTHQDVRAAPAHSHPRPPFRRRNRQELETYIHLTSNRTPSWHNTRRGRREGGGGRVWRRGGGDPDRRSSWRRAHPTQPAVHTHTTHTRHPYTHTAHVASEYNNLKPHLL